MRIVIGEGSCGIAAGAQKVRSALEALISDPIGKYLIMSCQGTACHVNGSERISAAITQYLGIENGQTTEDGLFTLEHVACLGCCSLAPVIMINGEAYGSLTPDKVVTILKEIQAKEGK